jgi:hypothetical protein
VQLRRCGRPAEAALRGGSADRCRGRRVTKAQDAPGVPSYVGKPFPIDRTREEIAKLRSLGINLFRLLVVWEGISPEGPGQYDDDYLQSLLEVVKTARDYGIYVVLDMHQNSFSRHLHARYNEHPAYGEAGSIKNALLSLIPPYTYHVGGGWRPAVGCPGLPAGKRHGVAELGSASHAWGSGCRTTAIHSLAVSSTVGANLG